MPTSFSKHCIQCMSIPLVLHPCQQLVLSLAFTVDIVVNIIVGRKYFFSSVITRFLADVLIIKDILTREKHTNILNISYMTGELSEMKTQRNNKVYVLLLCGVGGSGQLWGSVIGERVYDLIIVINQGLGHTQQVLFLQIVFDIFVPLRIKMFFSSRYREITSGMKALQSVAGKKGSGR